MKYSRFFKKHDNSWMFILITSWINYVPQIFMNSSMRIHEYCSLNVPQILMNSFMRMSWILFMRYPQYSWTVSCSYYESVIHELLWTVPFNVHEEIHEYFMNIIHHYSSKVHEYLFMKCSWTKTCMNFSFMNSYFDELCHLTFMHVHEQFMFFDGCSWTIFMNVSWIIHHIFAGE